ncbi:MAG TPA: hypothetical protein VN493_10150 [Thermoanaerobaculia bacterium]|nr:hypothetical protein [Thermoanaerobaculia bacterium]
MSDDALQGVQEPMTFEAYASEILGKDGMSLLLTCIDYRYPRRVLDAMARIFPASAYDQFILAGASLGACRMDWQDVLVQHVEAALFLRHDIKRIVILDHRDCGAYRHPRELEIPRDILDRGLPKDVLPSVEKASHQSVVSKLIPMLRKRLPGMEFHAWLLTREEDDRLQVP